MNQIDVMTVSTAMTRTRHYSEHQNDDVSYYKIVTRFDLAVGAVGGVVTLASKSIRFYGNL